ncbi:aminoacyl tRNA synthase complex-interacting multifunctional protein 1 [Nematocida homosporus]|uniref:aminoacyl tRNA synthase complex-interacting multifunctional protein 1 n=1 Tax=Nematocida homosporus TaxID=1912981 RepID=UPI00221FA37A|nr:aminoacyl tRNA synthase complex-interacting multifunctional protein 1 [Nematocida homosporus]KAI5184776.1 aminoacyl tRNA synthase complex-interacting multifunctional protein 1 [Nematocida homosporus]
MQAPTTLNWIFKLSPETSYLSILSKCYSNIKTHITEEPETLIKDPEGKTTKGPGKALSQFLPTQNISETAIRRIIDIITLRPQQMIAYTPAEEDGLDLIIAMAKIRKWLFEGQITNKVPENVIEKLVLIHTRHQEVFCARTKEVFVPADLITPIVDFYKVVVKSGTIESIINHPEADTLYIEIVDFAGEKRTIVSGLKGKVEKEALLSQHCLFTLNLKPVSFKGTKSFGMILFAKSTDKEGGSVIFTKSSGQQLTLKDYPLTSLIPFPIKISDCTKKTLESFFPRLQVTNELLTYHGLPTQVDQDPVIIPGIQSATIS